MDLVQKVADELLEVINDPIIKETIQEQISNLKYEIEIEIESIMSKKDKLSYVENVLDDFTSIFGRYEEKVSSLQLYITESIPSSFEETKKILKRTEIEKVENTKALETLCSMDIGKLKDDRANIQIITGQKLTVQKTFCLLLSCELNQYAHNLHRNLDRLPAFDKKYMCLIKWCKKVESQIKQDFNSSPTNAIRKLESIQDEVTSMKPNFDNAVSLGCSVVCGEQDIPRVHEKLSSLNLSLSQIEDLHAQRSKILFRVSKVISDLLENSKRLDTFLLTVENSIESSQDMKNLSPEEIQEKINYNQTLLNECCKYSDTASLIENLLKEVDSSVDDFSSRHTRNTLQYSQGVLLRWISFKEVVSKQILSLKNAYCQWDQFFNALEELEKWLTCKEEIASKTNYSDPGQSRNAYLDGVAVFEKLNHCFQDDIQILHSVNALFHDINKKDVNIPNSLKIRVSAANDRWHNLYKKIVEIFETLKNILQLWDDFDQLKEHLLLFLTEVDIKLTELETSPTTLKSSYESVEEDFELHESEKHRFLVLSNQLMKQSNCSVCTIQASVDEVMSYWEELFKRFLSLTKIQKQTTQEKENILHHSDDGDIEIGIPKEESCESLETVNLNTSPEKEFHDTRLQTYSEVASMPVKQDNKNEIMEHFVEPVVEQISSDYGHEKAQKIHPEKQSVIHSAQKKQKSFDDECIKDLLAALKEAEERIDSLERVLSEITPSGIDDHSPNYSRLLAACRSSIDVIQHLSQFLFYDVPQESSEIEKDEIKVQSEDLLERWQKIENLALNKELRVTENRRSWENFSKELRGFETWIQKALQDYSPATSTDADIEKLTHLLQRHKELISQIRAQKKTVLTLNITSQNFLCDSTDISKVTSLKQRIKSVNDHWDKLYSITLHWQNKLQTEFLQSSEFRSMLDDMKLWLKESEKRIDEMSQIKDKNDSVLHTQHTEFFALKQQLGAYCNRLETLLEITYNLFLPELHTEENVDMFEAKLVELQEELKYNLKLSQSLLIKCTEMLKYISSSLGLLKFHEQLSESQSGVVSASKTDPGSSDRNECCSFLMRVARASFPIQAILLLLLGAAILLPMEEEEEISCRLSNNFASSLNPMLRYPDGPPPV